MTYAKQAPPRVLLLGDALLDVSLIQAEPSDYRHHNATRVFESSHRSAELGGAGRTARWLLASGASVHWFCLQQCSDVANLDPTITGRVFQIAENPTSVPKRVWISGDNGPIRIDESNWSGDRFPIVELPDPSTYDVVLVNDYAQGTIAHVPPAWFAKAASSTPILWDPHNRGVDLIPPGIHLVMPNRQEAETITAVGSGPAHRALRTFEYGALARDLRDRWDARNVTIKLDQNGALSFLDTKGLHWTPPPRISNSDIDKSADRLSSAIGAGDVFCSSMAVDVVMNLSIEVALDRAVTVASRFVLGTTVNRILRQDADALRADALTVVRYAARNGATIVAVGGCFDLLHAGHVSLINAARAMGDVVVVLLNDDSSVARLKGEGRPVCTLGERVSNLREFAGIDAVYPFAEDTPALAITQIRPHVFIKGSDYAALDLPEKEQLDAIGAVAITVPIRPSVSTTEIVNRIREA